MSEQSTTPSDVTERITSIMKKLSSVGRNDSTQNDRLENVVTFYEYYNKCVEERRGEFDRIRKQLEQIIEELVEEGKIGKTVKILSRVKAPESALNKMLLTKKRQSDEGRDKIDMSEGTHDIYGVSIECDTLEELQTIKATLQEKEVNIEGERKRKESKRRYNAEHFNFSVEEHAKLKIECHMQTFEEAEKTYAHLYYKVLRARDGGKVKGEKLTEDEEIAVDESIQQQYASGELRGMQLSNGRGARVTQMWEATIDENGKFVRRELSEDEAIRRAYYPALEPDHIERVKQRREDQYR